MIQSNHHLLLHLKPTTTNPKQSQEKQENIDAKHQYAGETNLSCIT